jgi:hypothetical protein
MRLYKNTAMLVDVTQLRLRGRRLRATELQTPTRGILSVEFHSAAHSSFKRPVLAAELRIQAGGNMLVGVLTPIFDAHLLNLMGTEFSLGGIELESDPATHRVWEHMQVWRCNFVLDPSKPPVRIEPGAGKHAVPPPSNRVIPIAEVMERERQRLLAGGLPPD